MITRYKVKESLQVKEVVKFSNLEALGDGSFLVFIVDDTLSTDDLDDLKSEIDELSPVPAILCTKDFTVHEIVDKLNQDESKSDK